jgi:hypothetical protein
MQVFTIGDRVKFKYRLERTHSLIGVINRVLIINGKQNYEVILGNGEILFCLEEELVKTD